MGAAPALRRPRLAFNGLVRSPHPGRTIVTGSLHVASASPAAGRGKPPDGGRLVLRDARPGDRRSAGTLLRDALTPQLADAVFGLGAGGASRYFERLFQHQGTLWSHDITTLAELDGVVVGLVSHAPWAGAGATAPCHAVGLSARLRTLAGVQTASAHPRLDAGQSRGTPGPLVHTLLGGCARAPREWRRARPAAGGIRARGGERPGMQPLRANEQPDGTAVLRPRGLRGACRRGLGAAPSLRRRWRTCTPRAAADRRDSRVATPRRARRGPRPDGQSRLMPDGGLASW